MRWKRMMGMTETAVCPRCHGTFEGDDYDWDEDLCVYCLFPEAAKSRPIEVDYSEGVAKNRTKEGQLLDNLEFTPEKQSKQAIKSKLNHDYNIKKTKDL